MASSFVITPQLESLGAFEKPRIRFSVETWYRRHQVNSSITKGGMILFGGEEGAEKLVQTKRFFAQENKQDIFFPLRVQCKIFFPNFGNVFLELSLQDFFSQLFVAAVARYFFLSPRVAVDGLIAASSKCSSEVNQERPSLGTYHPCNHYIGFQLNDRIDYKILLLTFKALSCFAPSYIQDLICVKKKSHYNVRSNKDTILGAPRKTSKTLGGRAFCVAAPSLWNKLLCNLREVQIL